MQRRMLTIRDIGVEGEMRLYYDPITVNCKKVAAGFSLMNVPFEEARVDYLGGGHKAPEYLEINPNGSLPALVDGDFILWESNAILQYVADKREAFAYYPREPKLRADIHRWQLWESAHWYPSLLRLPDGEFCQTLHGN
jgi:glutathione S-transferase